MSDLLHMCCMVDLDIDVLSAQLSALSTRMYIAYSKRTHRPYNTSMKWEVFGAFPKFPDSSHRLFRGCFIYTCVCVRACMYAYVCINIYTYTYMKALSYLCLFLYLLDYDTWSEAGLLFSRSTFKSLYH